MGGPPLKGALHLRKGTARVYFRRDRKAQRGKHPKCSMLSGKVSVEMTEMQRIKGIDREEARRNKQLDLDGGGVILFHRVTDPGPREPE
jgi:hypothetical protein